MFEVKQNFFEQIATVTYDAINRDEEKSSLVLEIKNLILTEATKGNTAAKFNLGNRKKLTDEEIIDIAELVKEGFKIEIDLDMVTKEYPTLNLDIEWAAARPGQTDINGNTIRSIQ